MHFQELCKNFKVFDDGCVMYWRSSVMQSSFGTPLLRSASVAITCAHRLRIVSHCVRTSVGGGNGGVHLRFWFSNPIRPEVVQQLRGGHQSGFQVEAKSAVNAAMDASETGE